MIIKISLDDEMTTRLIQEAAAENRSVPRQAEVMLCRALGLPFPRIQPAYTLEQNAIPTDMAMEETKEVI